MLVTAVKPAASLHLQDASIGDLDVDMAGGRIDAAVIRTLVVTGREEDFEEYYED